MLHLNRYFRTFCIYRNIDFEILEIIFDFNIISMEFSIHLTFHQKPSRGRIQTLLSWAFCITKEEHKSNKRVQFRYGLVFLLNLTMNISDALRPKERAIQLHTLILYSSKDVNVKLTLVLIMVYNCIRLSQKTFMVYWIH